MFRNYVLVALRKLSREKVYVLINILSLALGIGGFLILALYLRSELTYDQHNVNHERIYRLATQFTNDGSETDRFAISQIGLGPLLVKDFPQLGQQVRFVSAGEPIITFEDNERVWDSVYFADATVFDIFTHEPLYGDQRTAFAEPYSFAISESLAKHYFGDRNPVGETLRSSGIDVKVTFVFKDLPENAHFRYDALVPIELLRNIDPNFDKDHDKRLWNVGVLTFLKVPENFDPASFGPIIAKFVDTYMAEQGKKFKTQFTAIPQPLAGIHYGEKFEADMLSGNIFYIYGFAAVAIFILLVACINYINLATARATKRAKEVGMRKVLGASRAQLVIQFLGESFIFTFIALLLALIAIWVTLTVTPLGTLMGKERLLADFGSPTVLLGVVGLAIVVALIAGMYPALYLSSISPLAALTEVRRSWKTGFSLRQILVFSQLAISIGVIACTLLMIDQMRYVHDKPLGFEKENRVVITLRTHQVTQQLRTIKAELERQPGVIDTTTITVVPGTGNWKNLIPIESNAGSIEPTSVDRIVVGLNFTDVMGNELVAGRGFSEKIETDVDQAVMVNEAMVRKMGWDEPLGKRMQGGPNEFARVVGVVRDYHYASLHNKIGPLVLTPMSDTNDDAIPEAAKGNARISFIAAVSGDNMQATFASIEATIRKFDPKFNFEPIFLEDRLNDMYKTEANLMKLTGVFAGICIFISVMGIFGLAAFTTEQRTKEIGIRKVLGASDASIVMMLSRPLLWLVLLAAIPASYVSYRAIDAWLQRFAYHTTIDWTMFALATLLIALVALSTVVLQSLKTTNANPVDALRYE